MGAPCNTLFMRCLEYLADSDSEDGNRGNDIMTLTYLYMCVVVFLRGGTNYYMIFFCHNLVYILKIYIFSCSVTENCYGRKSFLLFLQR